MLMKLMDERSYWCACLTLVQYVLSSQFHLLKLKKIMCSDLKSLSKSVTVREASRNENLYTEVATALT